MIIFTYTKPSKFHRTQGALAPTILESIDQKGWKTNILVSFVWIIYRPISTGSFDILNLFLMKEILF